MFFDRPVTEVRRRFVPNKWDVAAIPLILCGFVLLAHGAHDVVKPLAVEEAAAMSLDPRALPEYAFRTTLRMLLALVASLIFTLTYATLAARSRKAELVLIPILDILQSVPILGFISVTVTWFLSLSPGKVLGAECAAIFAIFTSQAWNMAFSFYQSLRTEPHDLEEVCRSYRLTPWQRFCRLDVPYAIPSLVWNMMMSMSGGWFFVVASEAITVGNRAIVLPGIGSYVAQAIEHRDLKAIGWAMLTMFIVILIYDQIMFRPLVAWAKKFRFEQTAGRYEAEPWVSKLMRSARLVSTAMGPFVTLAHWLSTLRLSAPRQQSQRTTPAPAWLDHVWTGVVIALALFATTKVIRFVFSELNLHDITHVFGLGAVTLIRVIALIVLASVVWVPIGIWIGVRRKFANKVQPLAQFLAAFPANLLFPLAVVGIVHYHLNPDVWLSPLMILGTQWYILFNVIAGASIFPNDLKEAAEVFRIRGWQRWKKVMLPAVFPYYITGALTASGGSWNASIVAEAVSWGDTKLQAHGIGAYIASATEAGDYPRIVLGIAVMSFFVILFNRFIWRWLYDFAERQFKLG